MNVADNELEVFLRQQGVQFEELSQTERWAHQQCWREVYCAAVHASTGKWTYRGCDWHTFSYGFAPSRSGTKAIEAYHAVSGAECLIMPDAESLPGLRCQATGLPDLSQVETGVDLYVFPPDLDWTMVFGHEGSFFCRREWLSQ